MKRALVLIALATGCASESGVIDSDEQEVESSSPRRRGEGDVSVTYAKTAKENWERAEIEYADDEPLAAEKYFRYIRVKFPYSSYAITAELRVADCLLKRELFLEAIDAYQNFVRLHPTHPQVAYATLMTGKAHYERMPEDWFFMPPAHEKDQKSASAAADALGEYVRRFPDDENIAAGRKMLREARQRLAAHERYVADFYERIDKHRARLGRLAILHEKFSDVAGGPELLLEIAEVNAELRDLEAIRNQVEAIRSEFPSSEELEAAETLLKETEVEVAEEQAEAAAEAAEAAAEEAQEAAAEEAAESDE